MLSDVGERGLRGPQQRHLHLGGQRGHGLIDFDTAADGGIVLQAGEQTPDGGGQGTVLELGRGEGGDDAAHVSRTLRGEVFDLAQDLGSMGIGGPVHLGVGDETDRGDLLSDRVVDVAGDPSAFLDLAGVTLGQGQFVLEVEQVLVGQFQGLQQLFAPAPLAQEFDVAAGESEREDRTDE